MVAFSVIFAIFFWSPFCIILIYIPNVSPIIYNCKNISRLSMSFLYLNKGTWIWWLNLYSSSKMYHCFSEGKTQDDSLMCNLQKQNMKGFKLWYLAINMAIFIPTKLHILCLHDILNQKRVSLQHHRVAG